MRVSTVIVCIGMAAFGRTSSGQPAGGDARPASPALASVAESLGTIEKRDLLRVRVAGLKAAPAITEKWVRVDDEGAASLPYVGGRKLAGKTTAQAEADVAKAYLDASVIRGAQVDVRRIEVGSRVKEATGKLAAGDLVEVSVDELTGPGATGVFRTHVSADGQLAVPLLGAMDLEGTREADAERAIAKEYQKRGMIQNAVVAVRVVQLAAESKVKAGPIAKGDLISLAIYGLGTPAVRSEFEARVGPDGAIGFPWVGAVPLAGLSEAKAPDAIAKALRDARLEESPIVSVCRLQSADQADVKLGPIEPGEVLRVRMSELVGPGVESVRAVRVDEQGQVAMPLAGRVKVAGLTEAAAATAIAKAYRDQNLIAAAQVSVLKINGNAPLPAEELRPAAPDAPSSAPPRQARAKGR